MKKQEYTELQLRSLKSYVDEFNTIKNAFIHSMAYYQILAFQRNKKPIYELNSDHTKFVKIEK